MAASSTCIWGGKKEHDPLGGGACLGSLPPLSLQHSQHPYLQASTFRHPKTGVDGMCKAQVSSPCTGSREFARSQLTPLNPIFSPSPQSCRGAAEAVGQVAGLQLPWESIACVRRAVRVSGQQASVHRPERGDWNVKRKRVHGNSELSPDEKTEGRGFFWQLKL